MPWRMAAALAANKRMLLLRCIASCPPRFPLLPAKTVATASRCLPERVPAAALSRTAAIFFRTKFSEGYSIAQRKYFYFSPLTDAHLSDIILPFCGRGGIGIRARLRGVWETVRVQVPSTAPNQYNPNLFPIGDGFGLFVFFDRYESTYFRNGVKRKPTSKPRGPRKKRSVI